MNVLDVHYCGWGEDWRLGRLADDGKAVLFEYSSEALSQGLELSPLQLKLRAGAISNFPHYQFKLPGIIADALPDGWGLLLMDRLFKQQGLQHPSALQRLAWIGDRALGALRFVPPVDGAQHEVDFSLLALAKQSARVLAGQATEVLKELAFTGGSPQGARPKALVQYQPDTGEVSTRNDAPGAPWLVKFPARHEHAEVCAIECLYLHLASSCGLEVPDCQLFELSAKISAFGIARFDRQATSTAELRVPIHSLAGVLHADFRQPGSVDYLAFLRATRALTRDEREVHKAFARAVFNVVFHNRDDHAKNFAFRLGSDRRWRLAPAYDLSFSEGPGGQHYLDVMGKGEHIASSDLLSLASASGIDHALATATIKQITNVASEFLMHAQAFPIRRATVSRIAKVLASGLPQMR